MVICEGAAPVRVLWSEMNMSTLEQAQRALAVRENISDQNIRHSIGHWTKESRSNHPYAEVVGDWAYHAGITGVVWTALKPKIGTEYRVPTWDEVVAHLATA